MAYRQFGGLVALAALNKVPVDAVALRVTRISCRRAHHILLALRVKWGSTIKSRLRLASVTCVSRDVMLLRKRVRRVSYAKKESLALTILPLQI